MFRTTDMGLVWQGSYILQRISKKQRKKLLQIIHKIVIYSIMHVYFSPAFMRNKGENNKNSESHLDGSYEACIAETIIIR